jgi:uncharacterized repeat protein (TIGR03843 family)
MALGDNPFHPDKILLKMKTVERLVQPGNSKHAPVTDSDHDLVLETLLKGKMELQGLMPWSSNYTFLVTLIPGNGAASLLGIYKPGDGERPLWDFPEQTLALREFASYLVSQALGWPNVPPTVLRNGPHGWGSVQLFIEAEYEAHYFNMRDTPTFTEDFRRIALFDYIINNADRKGGHCLKGKHGKIWAIDHGLTFHVQPKLRTVIWEFCEEAIPDPLLNDLARLQDLMRESELCQILSELINPSEIKALQKRIGLLVSTGNFPELRLGRNIPFPPI